MNAAAAAATLPAEIGKLVWGAYYKLEYSSRRGVMVMHTSVLAADGFFHRGTSSDDDAADDDLFRAAVTLFRGSPNEGVLEIFAYPSPSDLSLSTRFGRAAKYLKSYSCSHT